MTESDVIDRAALETLLEAVGGDTAFLAEMIDEYFADTPTLLATMWQALVVSDAAGLRRAAHALKSNSANFGAGALTELCRDLEARGKDGALDGAAPLLAQVEAEYDRVKPALQAAVEAG